MEDAEILRSINNLTDDEHTLLHEGEQHGGLTAEEHTHLEAVKVEIDRLWDLLRQRRARRHAGLNPAGAEERDASVVERYQQ